MKHLIVAGAMALAATGGAALAEYPEKPVEFIVPWSPGGGSDTLMRIVSNNVEPYLGTALPVINMPGVGGTVGLKEASRRAADGYTVSQIHEGLLVANLTGLTDLNWDSFDPIGMMTVSPQFLVINPDLPYKTLDEMLAYAKDNPGDITIGVTLGGVPHLHAAMIEDAYGIEFSYVGYEGTGERIRALVGGNLDAAIGDISSAKQFVDNGDLIFVATGNPTRMPQTPDVPTFVESGADLELLVTRGLVMPKGSPEEARAGMEAALEQLAADATFVEQVNNAGGEVDFRGQEAYAAYLAKLNETIIRLSDKLAP
jgi:tripartite-type tricarboxylate transporter receptor subunit TctC